MHNCGNGSCPRGADLTARIARVGDRHLCQTCFEALSAIGMDVRVLDPNAPLPAWRARGLARDMTTKLVAA